MNLPKFWHQKDTFNSKLFDQTDFYGQFIKDLRDSKSEVIIESPFISASRMEFLYPTFKFLIGRNIPIHIITRDPRDYDNEFMRDQATNEILQSKELGINPIMLSGYHHRKIAIIDRKILWEGSLNILSFNKSKEIMRRIDDKSTTQEMFDFLKIKKLIR